MGSGSFLKVVLKNFDVLAGKGVCCSVAIQGSRRQGLYQTERSLLFSSYTGFQETRPLVSLVYPLYASLKAIETKSHADDNQWLTYWILHSMITLFELTFSKVIQLLPFWPYAKLIFISWLVLPYFNGAAYVYQHFIRPLVSNTATVNIWYVPRSKDIFSKPDDILRAAEKSVKENGADTFQKLIGKSEKLSKSKTHTRRTILEEVKAKQEADAQRAELDADDNRYHHYHSIFGEGYS